MINGQSLEQGFGPYYPMAHQPEGYVVPPVWSDGLALLRDAMGPALAFRREMFADGGGYAVVPAETDNRVIANTNNPSTGSFIDRSFGYGLLIGGGLYLARRLLARRGGAA